MYYHGNSEIMPAKRAGNWESGAQLEGYFEIEKYEDALHMSWIVTPVSNYSCCITIGTGRNEKGAKREWGEMVRGEMAGWGELGR
jgi:hypothetical protein